MNGPLPLTAPAGENAASHEAARWVPVHCGNCSHILAEAERGTMVSPRPIPGVRQRIICKSCKQVNFIRLPG